MDVIWHGNGSAQPSVAQPLGHCQDQALALSLARDAGELLVELQREGMRNGVGASSLRDAGDRVSQDFLEGALKRERPLDAVLSEEAADSRERLEATRVWIIDPLDGTREFSEGRTDWAVHVALWEEGSLVAGAVALPGIGSMMGQLGTAPRRPAGGQLRIAVSRSRPPEFALRVAAELNAELVPMGSAGYKTWAVVNGEVDAYLHAGGQYEWDSAAPVFAARQAGLQASRIDGSALVYNQDPPYLPDVLVCQPAVGPLLLNAIGRARAADTELAQTYCEGSLS